MRLFTWTLMSLSLLWNACCNDEINEQRILRAPDSRLHCQTIKQYLMLDADVRNFRKGDKQHADKSGQGVRNMYFSRSSFVDNPTAYMHEWRWCSPQCADLHGKDKVFSTSIGPISKNIFKIVLFCISKILCRKYIWIAKILLRSILHITDNCTVWNYNIFKK